MTENKEKIISYYDNSESDYQLFWGLDKNLALHAGFWDETTRTLQDALERENEILAQKAGITSSDHVLDAGCGVGGSCIYLAKKYGCRATGITLSKKQAHQAKAYAKKHGVEDKVLFFVMDYTQTNFPEGHFDVVWGIESICHARNKPLFLREACRVLKKEGRLIVADGFASTFASHPEQLHKWTKRWGDCTLETVENFKLFMHQSGFKDIFFVDVTQNILPSSKRLFLISIPGFLYSKLGEFFGKRSKMQTDNIKAAFYQYQTLKRRLWKYGIFLGEKK